MALAGKTKQDIVSEFRRAEILAVARTVFAAKGFNDATVDEIAQAAGIAKGTVYSYYTSKREIYLAALLEGHADLRARTRVAMEEASGIHAKLHAFIKLRLQYAEDNRDFIRIYHAEFGNLTNGAASDGQVQEVYLEQARYLESVLRDAIAAGEIRATHPEPLAFLIYDMVRSVLTQRTLGWSKNTMEDDLNLLSNLIWNGVAPR